MCGFANCEGRHACLLADVSPCPAEQNEEMMEAFARPSRRRTKSARSFLDIEDAFANLDAKPSRVAQKG